MQSIPPLNEGERFILGIDGLSRSGKTTLAKNLEPLLQERFHPWFVFHMDDYIVEWEKRYLTGHEPWYEYYYLQWDVEALTRDLFQPMREKGLGLPDTAGIIVEGVFLQREEWCRYFDYVIYLQWPRQERFQRESEETRKKQEKFKERYWKAEDYYLQTVKPETKANLVL
ncbi:AAA family ATPase [Halobacillus karajensis]|nr:AAA family ATPase [Halobacillus karajensis]